MQESPITIVLNGTPTPLPAGTTVAQLIVLRNLTPEKVAVEVNRRLVRASDYGRQLQTGDEVELVTFVGGG
jgi:sulfur carrier protein